MWVSEAVEYILFWVFLEEMRLKEEEERGGGSYRRVTASDFYYVKYRELELGVHKSESL